jgi:Domain of unknown function (DUF5658)
MNLTPGALLAFNLLLQGFDGTASYLLLSQGAPEANPLIETAVRSWGLGWGLLFWKAFSCILLFLLHSIRLYRESLTVGALSFVAAVYCYLPVVIAWGWAQSLLRLPY